MGQDIPPERRSTSQQSNFPQPLRHHPRRRPVYPEERDGRAAGDCHKRPVRRRQGAGIRPVRAGTRQTRLPYDSLRPVIHRRERRTTPLCGVARHQHRGLLRGGGLPLNPRRRGPGADRHPRHLRLGRNGGQRGCRRHAHQGHRRRQPSTRASRPPSPPQCTT